MESVTVKHKFTIGSPRPLGDDEVAYIVREPMFTQPGESPMVQDVFGHEETRIILEAALWALTDPETQEDLASDMGTELDAIVSLTDSLKTFMWGHKESES